MNKDILKKIIKKSKQRENLIKRLNKNDDEMFDLIQPFLEKLKNNFDEKLFYNLLTFLKYSMLRIDLYEIQENSSKKQINE